jgi:hypothetical protein
MWMKNEDEYVDTNMKYVSVSDWMRFGAVVINRMGYFKVKNIIKEIGGFTKYIQR